MFVKGFMRERRLSAAMTAGLLFVLVVGATASTAARDRKAPRIAAAAVEDADRDGRADRLRLTYSEPIRHVRDADGAYPFRVAGHRIRKVGAAAGRVLLVSLIEPPAGTGAPSSIRYATTRAKPVRDRAGNQAAAQTVTRIRVRVVTPKPEPEPKPEPTPNPTPADRDGDGVRDADDCAPADPAIKPGAPDLPDLAFVDSNCDGIDGTEKKAIFVSSPGGSPSPGTKASPMRELQAGVAAASLSGKDVYVTGGEFGRVETAGGVDIYGGYVAGTWKRDLNARTRITGAPEAVLASGDTVVLQLLTVVGRSENRAGSPVYGIRAIASSKLTLQRVTVVAGNGLDGVRGAEGLRGAAGQNGGRGEAGNCDGEVGGSNGRGGGSPAGHPGGLGGRGGVERIGWEGGNGHQGKAGTLGGAGGANGNPGKPGKRGGDGLPGKSGAQGNGGSGSIEASARRTWSGGDGTDGAAGTPGMGGGGGGGGGGQKGRFVIDGVGNAGGGGGGGGGGGTGGKSGGAGGASFGIYLHDSAVAVLADSSIQAGAGGAGGAGGRGGLPGPGGNGADGGSYCTGEVGAGGRGGNGGGGGIGGGGGGGAGGPSIGVLKAGTSSATLTGTTIKVGTPGPAGAPGAGGGGGTPAYPGIAREVYP